MEERRFRRRTQAPARPVPHGDRRGSDAKCFVHTFEGASDAARRLLPYYLLAVFFVIAHAFAGLRIVMLAHGAARQRADRVLYAGCAFAAVLATAIILAMSGMRLA